MVDESIEGNANYMKHMIEKLNISTQSITLTEKETAELLLGKTDLSQRGYKRLRTILLKSNVILPSYETVRKYSNNLDVGVIDFIHDKEENTCCCMDIKTSFKDTLQHIVSNEKLFQMFQFPSMDQQRKLENYLKSKDLNLYQHFDPLKRSIIIRATGDNFRAAARFPTEQTSYSILNIRELANNPYGQFIQTLWRGSEDRDMLFTHVHSHYEELSNAVKNGITLSCENGNETFNVIVFLVADLSYIKDVIGHSSSTSKYGCFQCKMPANMWIEKSKKEGPCKGMSEMVSSGLLGEQLLRRKPDKNSAMYKNFILKHYGQYVSVVFLKN